MIVHLMFLLVLNIPQADTSLEQHAVDYFFENIFINDFPDEKVIRFHDSTFSDHYSGIVHQCKNWSDSLAVEIITADPSSPKSVNAGKSPVRVKRVRRNSSGLQISVFSAIKIKNHHCVLITAYKKLRFVEYYYFIIDHRGKIIDYCKVGEII